MFGGGGGGNRVKSCGPSCANESSGVTNSSSVGFSRGVSPEAAGHFRLCAKRRASDDFGSQVTKRVFTTYSQVYAAVSEPQMELNDCVVLESE